MAIETVTVTAEEYEGARKPDENELGTARALRQAFSAHFGVHGDEWMKVQARMAGRYSYRSDSDLEKCRICAALGAAISALEESEDVD